MHNMLLIFLLLLLLLLLFVRDLEIDIEIKENFGFYCFSLKFKSSLFERNKLYWHNRIDLWKGMLNLTHVLMKSHLFIHSFMSLVLKDIVVKILLLGISEKFLPMFSSRTFMVLWLIFMSFIHLEFIFVCGVSWWLSLIFACSCPDLPTPTVEEAVFAPFYAPASLVKY